MASPDYSDRGTLQHASIDQRSHDLFDEERVPAGAFHQETIQGRQTGVGTQQSLKEIRELLAGEGIEA